MYLIRKISISFISFFFFHLASKENCYVRKYGATEYGAFVIWIGNSIFAACDDCLTVKCAVSLEESGSHKQMHLSAFYVVYKLLSVKEWSNY